jgi:hypothetical protein
VIPKEDVKMAAVDVEKGKKYIQDAQKLGSQR